MTRTLSLAGVVACAAIAVGLSTALAGDVSVGAPSPRVVVAPAPPPPFVVESPPKVVIVPGTSVYHILNAPFDLFLYGGHYYSFHHGAWFRGSSHNGPWKVIAVEAVPKPVLALPVSYFKVPPGQARREE
jgi:hypothetical protein